jgi:hypothetical protein
VTVASGIADRKRSSKALTADSPQVIRFAEMWGKHSRAEIRDTTGMTEAQIGRWRIKLGLPIIGKGNRPTFSLEEAKALRNQGLSYIDTARHLGVSENSVRKALAGQRVSDGAAGDALRVSPAMVGGAG